MILSCKCENKWQDQQYGFKKRIFNECASREKMYRCTVCGNERVL